MNTFESFKLKTNPFRITPAINSEELIWAGFPELKKKLENRIKRSIFIPNSSLVLNWGEYGSGKTHASRYFNKTDVLRELSDGTRLPFSLNISFPKSKQPVLDIYTQIIDKIEIRELREQISNSKIDVLSTLDLVTDNPFIRDVVKLMIDDTIDATKFKGYLHGTTVTVNDLKTFANFGVYRKLAGENDYIELLAALFSFITYDKKPYSCIILWMDEFEDISILNSTGISSVNNFLRTIIDKTPNNLLMFLNLTQSAMMDVEDLGAYLYESVKQRIKETIELTLPTKEELKEYLCELLNNSIFRDTPRNDFFPFEEKVVDKIISDLGNVSLRRFNEAFSLLLENALFENKDIIDVAYYDTMRNEVIGWNG
jgi:hypothetical protein